ncbi:MAG TPA: hypothetical protein VFP84_01585 [Kofleriaceae bacterium]|nr:hypothetical protein [Kofleriaceae bacterium]
MIKTQLSSLTISCLSIAALAACGGDDGGGATTNPKTLWLAPDGSELEVKLVGSEPPPY